MTIGPGAPVAGAPRVEAVDVTRGFALFGVFWANLFIFSGIGYMTEEQRGRLFPGSADTLAYLGERFFIENKFMGLFSLLFGISFWLFLDRVGGRGPSPLNLFYRRIFWLFVIGALHGWLLWWGDRGHARQHDFRRPVSAGRRPKRLARDRSTIAGRSRPTRIDARLRLGRDGGISRWSSPLYRDPRSDWSDGVDALFAPDAVRHMDVLRVRTRPQAHGPRGSSVSCCVGHCWIRRTSGVCSNLDESISVRSRGVVLAEPHVLATTAALEMSQ
jgi:hypothetical protein